MGKDTQVLVEDASRGDVVAVEGLLERFLPDLRRYLDRNAGALVTAKESSSDLAQSVCREVLERLGTERFVYRGEAEFKQWLYNAALYKIRARQRFYLAAMRDAGREVLLPEGGSETHASSEPGIPAGSTLGTPSQAAALNEEVERLRVALSKLPQNYREVIHLAHVEGLSHKEIAERLGISEANSRVLLSRALARLATLGIQPS
jgi:RNA polymerase sigma factor (sigma-70 family)